MSEFVNWVWNRLERGQRGTLPNGILYLKGGDLAEELALTGNGGMSTTLRASSKRSSSRPRKWSIRPRNNDCGNLRTPLFLRLLRIGYPREKFLK